MWCSNRLALPAKSQGTENATAAQIRGSMLRPRSPTNLSVSAAQAEADQRNAAVGLSLLDVLEDALQIVGRTAMIGTQAAVGLAAATAEISCQYI